MIRFSPVFSFFFFSIYALLILDYPSGHAALVPKNYDLHDCRMMI